MIGRDLFHKHVETLQLLQNLGFTTTYEKLARVDLQVMVPLAMNEILDIESRNKIVCTAQSYSYHGKGLKNPIQTFTLGSISVIQICIYDKRAEMKKLRKSNPVKYQLMMQECFGETWEFSKEPCTRVEFRLGREQLRSMQINTMSDLLESEQALARYCCKKWFRILEEPKKRGHSHEQEISKEWQQVQEAFDKWFPGADGHNKEVRRTYREDIKCEPEHLEKQSVGCLATMLALTEGMGIDLDAAKSKLYEIIRSNVDKILTLAKDRADRLGIKTGLSKSEDYRDAMDLDFANFKEGNYLQPELILT